MANKDYIDSIKDGVQLMGKMAARGVSQFSRQLKGDIKEDITTRRTGLYFMKNSEVFKELIPRIQYFESVCDNRLEGGFVKKMVRSSADRKFVSACYALMFGNEEIVLNKLRESIADSPQFTDSYFLSGCIHLTRKEFKKSEEHFSKCRLLPTGLGIKLKSFLPTFCLTLPVTDNTSFLFMPDVIGLNLLLSLAQRNDNNMKKAIETLEQILSVMPDNQELTFFLTAYYYETRQYEKIIDLLKEMIPSNDLEVLTVQFLVKAWVKKRNLGVAEGIVQKALEAKNIEPAIAADLKMLLARIVKKAGRSAESSAYESRVKKQYPNYRDLCYRLGLLNPEEPSPEPLAVREEETDKVDKPPFPKEEDRKSEKRKPTTSKKRTPGKVKKSKASSAKLVSSDGKINVAIPESLVIGREEGDLLLPGDSSASRTHARIFRQKGQIWVEDLDSTNGTWINNHRITDQRVLNRGDILLIGKTEFHLE